MKLTISQHYPDIESVAMEFVKLGMNDIDVLRRHRIVLEGIRDHARKGAALVDFDQMTLVLEFHGVDYPDRRLIFTMSKLHGRCLMGFADEEPVRATSTIIENAFRRLNEQKPKKPRKRQPKKAEAIV